MSRSGSLRTLTEKNMSRIVTTHFPSRSGKYPSLTMCGYRCKLTTIALTPVKVRNVCLTEVFTWPPAFVISLPLPSSPRWRQ